MVYEIILERIGDIILLPDSQRLFGFLMSQLNKFYKSDEVSNFVKKVHENKLNCMISNLFPIGCIPAPKAYMLDRIPNHSKETYGLIKKMEYMDETSFRFVIDHINLDAENLKKEIKENVSFVSTKQVYSQKFKLEAQEKALPGLANEAYSLPTLEFFRKNKNVDEKCDIFSFFVKTEEDNILSSYLEELCNGNDNETEKIYGLGSKESHGYNTYKLIKAKKYSGEKNMSKYIYLNMGMLLPQIEKINIADSFLDIYSSNRKSYEISDNIEKVISFISPGSVVSINDGEDSTKIGKCIPNDYNLLYENAIVFGNSFIKKIEVSK